MKTWQEALEAATAKTGADASEITLDGSCRASAVEVGVAATLITCFAAGGLFQSRQRSPPAGRAAVGYAVL